MEGKEFSTTDLALAGFLRLKGLPIKHVEVVPGNKRKSRFVFDDTIDVAEQLVLEFTNSEFMKYDSNIRALKKLIHK